VIKCNVIVKTNLQCIKIKQSHKLTRAQQLLRWATIWPQ